MQRNLTYCIIDVTDPLDELECEGVVIKGFFSTTSIFDRQRSRDSIHFQGNLVGRLVNDPQFVFNIFHLAGHGSYYKRNARNQLDEAVVYAKRGNKWIEVFAPDSVVRAELEIDVFVSTCCETFNDHFIGVLGGYRRVRNFIAPNHDANAGDATVFSLMFYNQLVSRISRSRKSISDKIILESFRSVDRAYKLYGGTGDFKMYNWAKDKRYP
jgi:hypothetical protein